MDQQELSVVRVLVLIDEHVLEPPRVALADLGPVTQEPHRLGDEVVEVERSRGAQHALVLLVDVGETGPERVRRRARHVLGGRERVLGVGDLRQHGARTEWILGQLEALQDLAYHVLLVLAIVDHERRGESECPRLAAQDAHGRGVERSHPHRTRRFPERRLEPGAHLARGAVREREREHGLWPHAAREQPCHARGEHARLAAAGAGDDQQRPARILDRGALGVVERERRVHEAKSPAR
jgi:hypothetical protein